MRQRERERENICFRIVKIESKFGIENIAVQLNICRIVRRRRRRGRRWCCFCWWKQPLNCIPAYVLARAHAVSSCTKQQHLLFTQNHCCCSKLYLLMCATFSAVLFYDLVAAAVIIISFVIFGYSNSKNRTKINKKTQINKQMKKENKNLNTKKYTLDAFARHIRLRQKTTPFIETFGYYSCYNICKCVELFFFHFRRVSIKFRTNIVITICGCLANCLNFFSSSTFGSMKCWIIFSNFPHKHLYDKIISTKD